MSLILIFNLILCKPDLNRYFDIKNGCLTSHKNLSEIINYDQGVVKQMAGNIYDIILSNHFSNHEFSRKHYQQEFYKDIFTEKVLKKITTRYKAYSEFDLFYNLPGQFLESFATETVPLIKIFWLCEVYGDYDQINNTFQFNNSITKLIIDSFELTNSYDQQTPLFRFKACVNEDFLEKLNCAGQFNFFNKSETVQRDTFAIKEKQNSMSKGEFEKSNLFYGKETKFNLTSEKFTVKPINPYEIGGLSDTTTEYNNFNNFLQNETKHFNEPLVEVSHNTTSPSVFYVICALLVIIFGMLSIFKIKESCKNKRSYNLKKSERKEISIKNSRKDDFLGDKLEEEIKVTEV